MKACSIDGCTRAAKARGWCGTHYAHWHTYGDPVPAQRPTTEERLLAGVTHGEAFNGTPCWEWQGGRLPSGYGRLSVDNERRYTHRLAWELFRGPIPDGLFIDHLCENKRCCNPEHLEPVPPAVNTRRAFQKVTACPQGHPYDDQNTYTHPTKGYRKCRACDRANKREHAA